MPVPSAEILSDNFRLFNLTLNQVSSVVSCDPTAWDTYREDQLRCCDCWRYYCSICSGHLVSLGRCRYLLTGANRLGWVCHKIIWNNLGDINRGQLTATGVPAIDFAWHKVVDQKTGFVLDVGSIDRQKDNVTPAFWNMLHNLTTNGRCW